MIHVYDNDLNLAAVWDCADGVSYSLPHNDLWTAKFRVPSRDARNGEMIMHRYVRIEDGARDIGMYRLTGVPGDDVTALAGWCEYSCEHVMATLLDDLLFGYWELGGANMPTRAVIASILAQQETERWVLGDCEFNDTYAYSFENADLLSALMSLGNVLTEPYTWEFDTASYPWRVHLRRAGTEPDCGVYYKRNMQEIRRSVDAKMLTTRLYLLGYGEGVNQLTVKSVNNGLPYIDADTIGTFGVKKAVHADLSIEDPAVLLAMGRSLLEKVKLPVYTYTAKAVDLVQLTGDDWDMMMPGRVVQVMDGEDDVAFQARITAISKSDVQGRPGDLEIQISNSVHDITGSISELASRQGVSELYSQGATNLYAQQYSDNADADHPGRLQVYIPSSCVRINQMLLSFKLAPFRAYETGAAAGGGKETTSASGGGSSVTSESGGGKTVTATGSDLISGTSVAGVQTGLSEGQTTGDSSVSITSASDLISGTSVAGVQTGLNESQTTGDSSVSITSASDLISGTSAAGEKTGLSSSVSSGSGGGGSTGINGVHSHEGNSHTHSFSGSDELANGHYHTISNPGTSTITSGVSANATHNVSISGTTGSKSAGTQSAGGHSHELDSHTHSVPAHTHPLDGTTSHFHNISHGHSGGSHSHSVPAHVHPLDGTSSHWHEINHSHTINITGHTHSVSIPAHSHKVTLQDHTHDIVYGIYEGATAESVTLIVDGNAVPADQVDADEMDLVAWLEKDGDGRITRGRWHTVEIVPDGLTRIEANLFVQTFIQSRSGGDY